MKGGRQGHVLDRVRRGSVDKPHEPVVTELQLTDGGGSVSHLLLTGREAIEVISIDFDNTVDAFATILTLKCKNGPNVLKNVTYRLLALQLSISFLSLQTSGGITVCVIGLTDSSSVKLTKLTMMITEEQLRDPLHSLKIPSRSNSVTSIITRASSYDDR